MSKKRKSIFAEQEEEENAKLKNHTDNLISQQISFIKAPEKSQRFKAIAFLSAHLNYASTLTLSQNINSTLQQHLWDEIDAQLVQHIIKLLADIAVRRDIPQETTHSVVDILHKYLEAHHYFDDFVTTQIISSLNYIYNQTGVFSELDGAQALSLLCTNKVSLRTRLLNLLGLTSMSKNEENNEHGELVFKVFEAFTKDPYPSVRQAALEGLISLHLKGFHLTKGCYRRAVALFQDKDELVRLSAIKLVSEWVNMLHQTEEGQCTNQINEAFLQLCTISRDMNMKVRSEALYALGRVGPLSENVLLQALSKKILGQATKKVSNSFSCGTLEGDKDLECYGRGLDLLTLSAAGAFLHGVEDEFSEVRIATIDTLIRLSGFSKKFADNALDLLMDMLNDDSTEVRMHTLHGLLHMAHINHLTVQEKHMHMFLGMLEDINSDIRSAARKLLCQMKLPSISMFKMTVEALMTNLDKHPQDEQDIIFVMYCMGKIHGTYVVCSANEFVQQITVYSNEDLGLDQPRVAALLIMMLAAEISNVGIRFQIPKKVVSYAKYFHGKFIIALGSTVTVKMLSPPSEDWQKNSRNSNNESLIASRSEVPDRDEGKEICQSFRCETNKTRLQFTALEMGDGFPNNLLKHCETLAKDTDAPEMRQHKQNSSCESEILHMAKNIVRVVAGTWPLIKQKALVGVLKTLSECREDLGKIKRNFEGSSSVIAFSSLYIYSIQLLAKLWANLTPGSRQNTYHSGINSWERLLQQLDKALRRMVNCFLGLGEEQELRILELNALSYMLRFSVSGLNVHSQIFIRLKSLVFSTELLYEGLGLEHSDFLGQAKKQLCDDDPNSSSLLKLVQELPTHFVLESIPLNEELKEIRAILVVPDNSYEHPLKFVIGVPLGITMHITLHNVTTERRIWLLMVLGDSVQYNQIDVNEFEGNGGVKSGSVTVPFYATKKVASCFLEVSVMMECPFEYGRVLLNRFQAGPKGELVSLSNVKKIDLVASVEKRSNT